MGHTRLGRIPKTLKWKDVVAELVDSYQSTGPAASPSSDVIAQIASKALLASEKGLQEAVADVGMVYSFYLLTQLALTGKKNDWETHLKELGILLSENDTPLDLTSQLHNVVDNYMNRKGRRTDVGEISQRALGEAVSATLNDEVASLFAEGKGETVIAVQKLGTKNKFADLGQRFFGAFMTRYLNFYLSRVIAQPSGGINAQSLFNKALAGHCHQSARIIRDFCGQWFTKTEYEQGIDLDNTARFVAIALKKLRSELEYQRIEG